MVKIMEEKQKRAAEETSSAARLSQKVRTRDFAPSPFDEFAFSELSPSFNEDKQNPLVNT